MSGLFEDDAGVRPTKKVKPVAEKKAQAPRKTNANKILDKIAEKHDLVSAASSTEGVAFEEIDVRVVERESKSKKDSDDKIAPPINYVSDTDGSV